MAVVFTDTFTVASDIDIASYPSGSPDWAYARGTPGEVTVRATDDRAIIATAGGVTRAAYLIAAAAPTGDQAISATGFVQVPAPDYATAQLLVRASFVHFYIMEIDFGAANECLLFRRDNATTQTLLTSADRGLTVGGALALRLQATGTGATVTVEGTFAGTAPVTFADSSAERITTGSPGIGGLNDTGTLAWIDDVSVEDLGGAPATKAPPPRRRTWRTWRRVA